MDVSQIYIEMCYKAEEIQKSKDMFQVGDFLWRGEKYLKEACICDKVPCFKDEKIWLPRQDQMQEMIIQYRHLKYPRKEKFCAYYLYLDFCDWIPCLGREMEGKGILNGNSMEQLWLAFVMYEKFGKQWSEGKWINIKYDKKEE